MCFRPDSFASFVHLEQPMKQSLTVVSYFSFYISDVCTGTQTYIPKPLTPLTCGKDIPTPQHKNITVLFLFMLKITVQLQYTEFASITNILNITQHVFPHPTKG